jgi:magnesium chelatase family protein
MDVPRVEYEKLSDDRLGEPLAVIQALGEATRERQRCRFEGTSLFSNTDMGPAEVWGFCRKWLEM